ncbi:MAG: FG-GAP-like repeat-containing protein [Thermoplasmata archaeon]
MSLRLFLCAALALLLCAPTLPPVGISSGTGGRALYTTLTSFDDGSTEVVMHFYEAGSNASASISIPARAIMKRATVQLWGHMLGTMGCFVDDTTEDFLAGNATNITVHNGSLLLRPFLSTKWYNTGSRPSYIATGDLNSDGLTDVAVVNSGSDTVSVLRQNRTFRTLEAQLTYNFGPGLAAAAIGDLNGDSREDLAVACAGSGTLEVLYQASDGSLGSATRYVSGGGARGLAIGDFNRDGRKDVVVVNSNDGTISLFLQSPPGLLERKAVIQAGSAPWAVAAGDVNLDGKDEAVVVCRGDSTLVVFRQDPSEFLVRDSIYEVGAGPVCIAIGDLNRDSRKDVVVAEQNSSSIGLLLQSSNGSLGPRTAVPLDSAPASVACGDVSYDGRSDVVAACPASNRTVVLLQQSEGLLAPPDDYRTGSSPSFSTIADLNLDGKCDIAVASSGDGTLGVLLMRPTPPAKLNQMVSYAASSAPIGLDIADLNADGLEDAVVGNAGSNTVGVFLQGQDGRLQAQRSYSLSTPLGLTTCDLNLDGRTDIIGASQGSNEIVILYQTSNGDFTGSPVRCPVNLSTGGLYIVDAGDLNSDGRPDIAVSGVVTNLDEPNVVVVLMQNPSTGEFDTQLNLTCAGARGVAIGDVNHDGRNDLCCVASTDTELHIHLQQPDGTLRATPVRYSTDSYPHGLRVADINHDGRNDVVVACWNANSLNIFYQTASGELAPRKVLSVSSLGVDVEVGDYDSDGLRDLAVSHYSGSSTLSLLNQTREGAFLGPTSLSTGNRPAMIASGDLDGDGKLDLGVANQISGNIGVFTQQFSADTNGIYVSRTVELPYEVSELTPSWLATLTGTNQSLSVEVTNDGGMSWTRAVNGHPATFAEPGHILGYKVAMSTIFLDRSPRLENMTIHYIMSSYPVDPSLDIGDVGRPIWSWSGPFGPDPRPAIIDFTERVNATLHTVSPGGDGLVRIPIVVRSGSLGTLRLTNLSVSYDLAPERPVLLGPVGGEFVTTLTPAFRLLANDSDTTELQFKIEISTDNFTTFKVHSQVVTNDGWDKSAYRPGEPATFQLSHFDRLQSDGPYSWRAYVWDGSVWSPPSEPGFFRVDTRPPDARVEQLSSYQNTTRFTVRWSGSDPEPGSGLAPTGTFDVQFKDRESAPWQDWLTGTNLTSAEFPGAQGRTYYFQVRARDAAGNTGTFPMGNGDTQTMVDATPPSGSVVDDGDVTQEHTRLHAIFSFSDVESGIVRYEYWIGTAPGSSENLTLPPTVTESSEVTATSLFLFNGTRYYFTVRALNGAGLWSQPQSSDGILVRLRAPAASVTYTGGVQAERLIHLNLASSDPNLVGILDGDLEFRSAPVIGRAPGEWTSWTEFGQGDWGEPPSQVAPLEFEGEPGRFYRFRYRTKDAAGTFSDYTEPGVFVRINRAPQPQIGAKSRAEVGQKIAFTAAGSSDEDGDPMRFTWDFGDGAWGYGAEVKHSYKKPGRYTVTLYADDGVENSTTALTVRVEAPPSGVNALYIALPVVAIAAALAGFLVYAVVSRRSRARAQAPTVVPGTEYVPPPPPATREEAEAEIAAARNAIKELEEVGVDTVRASRMLALAESFLSDGNPDMAAQYARKTMRLARDQKERKESEVDEDTARQFINLTQRMLEDAEEAGLEVREAKKLFGLSMSFLAEGNYVTGMQYSKKVRKILAELRERKAVTLTREAVEKEQAEAGRLLALLEKEVGEEEWPELERVRESIELSRMFLEEGDLEPAMEAASKARGAAKALKEGGRPLSPQEWKERLRALRARLEELRGEGLKVSEPQKMLKFSESFAMSGNMEIATQYLRKAEKLVRDMEERAGAEAVPEEKTAAPAEARAPALPPALALCPECGERVEEDWVVCPLCDHPLKNAPPPAQAGQGEGAPRVARPVENGGEPRVARPVQK